MEELTGSQMLAQAATLIGKQVTAKLAGRRDRHRPVTQVQMVDGKPKAVVNGQQIDTSLITTLGS